MLSITEIEPINQKLNPELALSLSLDDTKLNFKNNFLFFVRFLITFLFYKKPIFLFSIEKKASEIIIFYNSRSFF